MSSYFWNPWSTTAPTRALPVALEEVLLPIEKFTSNSDLSALSTPKQTVSGLSNDPESGETDHNCSQSPIGATPGKDKVSSSAKPNSWVKFKQLFCCCREKRVERTTF